MAQHSLNINHGGAIFQQMSGETMTQRMKMSRVIQSGFFPSCCKNLLRRPCRYRAASGLAKDKISGIFINDEQYLRVWMLASKRLDAGSGVSGQIIGQANRMVLWEAISYAKEHGMKMFDFCGIDLPEREGDPLPSLTVYKEAFGGRRLKNFYYTKTYSAILRFLYIMKKKFLGR